MLETPEERVLLRAGLTGKQIELLYLQVNDFEICEVDWHDPEHWTNRLFSKSIKAKRSMIFKSQINADFLGCCSTSA